MRARQREKGKEGGKEGSKRVTEGNGCVLVMLFAVCALHLFF
jgi:hypothetical protein